MLADEEVQKEEGLHGERQAVEKLKHLNKVLCLDSHISHL